MIPARVMEHVLETEGGFVNHPLDNGGPTKFGITLKTYQEALNLPDATANHLKYITEDTAELIYRIKFWQPSGIDRINSQTLQLVLFDQMIHRGIKPAVVILQKFLNSLYNRQLLFADGVLGPATAEECNRHFVWPSHDFMELVFRYQDSYVEICKASPSQVVFLKGWIRRTHSLLRLCR